MQISSPVNERIIDEYDFFYSSGTQATMYVDEGKGDRIEFAPDEIRVTLVAKKFRGSDYPEEAITIYREKLDSYAHRTRTVLDPTPEQEDEWASTITKLSNTIN